MGTSSRVSATLWQPILGALAAAWLVASCTTPGVASDANDVASEGTADTVTSVDDTTATDPAVAGSLPEGLTRTAYTQSVATGDEQPCTAELFGDYEHACATHDACGPEEHCRRTTFVSPPYPFGVCSCYAAECDNDDVCGPDAACLVAGSDPNAGCDNSTTLCANTCLAAACRVDTDCADDARCVVRRDPCGAILDLVCTAQRPTGCFTAGCPDDEVCSLDAEGTWACEPRRVCD